MLAVPLQGLAAASMLFCGAGMRHGQMAMQVPVPQEASAHGTHGGHLGHDGPAHSATASSPEAQSPEASQAAADALPDAAHKCGACSACCHNLGMASAGEAAAFAGLFPSGFAEPFAPVLSRALQVPDKPPRA